MADIYEQDIFRIKLGSPAQIVIPGYPGGPVPTKVDWISGTLDPATRTAKVRCVLANRTHLLRPEMYATALIQVPRDQALAIPRTAVVRLGNLTCAFVELAPGPDGTRRFERRPVQVDEQIAGDLLPVKDGLRAGDRVVAKGALSLAGLS
jgi:cobalt-zinc-cadmium efflux system membrane fusion protein